MPKDQFETLCRVKADVSTAPYTSGFATGNVGYRREYHIVLLVGLTELKAQASWIDSATVRMHPILHTHLPHSIPHAWIQGTERRFVATFSEFLMPKLNPASRGDAVVVYDNPSERVAT